MGKTNWDGFRGYFQDNLAAYIEGLQTETDINNCWNLFSEIFHAGIEIFVPQKLVSNSVDPLWYTKEVKRAMRTQRQLRNKSRKTQSTFDNANHREARKRVQHIVSAAFKH